jgi:hypothetical protein
MTVEIAMIRGTATATPSPPRRDVSPLARYGPIYEVNESKREAQPFLSSWLRPRAVAAPAGVSYLWVPTVTAREPGWLAESDRQLEELLELEEDWDSYGAGPPNQVAVALAKKLLRRFAEADLPAPRVNPSVEEGVCLSFRIGSIYAGIECFNSGEVLAATSDGHGEHRVWEVGSRSGDILRSVRLIRSHLNSASL